MEKVNYKKSKYQQVAEIMEKGGYISDTQLTKIWGDESGISKASEHIRIWKKLKSDRDFFADKKILEKHKGHRSHLVRIEGQPEGQYYKVGRQFYESITQDNK
jgi:ribosomal protein S8